MLTLHNTKQLVKSFLSKHLPMTPWNIQLEVTNACNMRCIMCPTNSPVAIERRKNVMLDWDLFVKIIDEAATFPRCHIIPQGGGEPMIHPRFLDMLSSIKQKPNLTVGFVTNGSCLKPDVIEELIDMGIEEICVSVDAFSPEDFKEITSKDCYEFVVNAVRTLVQRRNDRHSLFPKVIVQRVSMPKYDGDLEPFVQYWSGIVDEVLIIKERDLTGRMIKGFHPNGKPRRACRKPFEDAAIGADGNLCLCCDDWHEHHIMGNVNEKTIREIWFSAQFKEARRCHKQGRFEAIDICANCYAPYETASEVTVEGNRIIAKGLSVDRIRKRRY